MKSKLLFSLTIFLGLSFQLFSQQFYYSSRTKIFLKEDTTILVFKIEDQKSIIAFSESLDKNVFTKIDTSKTKGVFEATLKVGVNKDYALKLLLDNKEIIYAWHSLKTQNTVIIPTGEILLLPKKGVQLDAILSKAKIKKDWTLKKIDKYGVITLSVNSKNLFSFANLIYESEFVQ